MSEVTGPVSFSLSSGLGLNNQKLAVLGLLMRGLDEHRPVVLPRLTLFDPAKAEQASVPFDQVFDKTVVCEFAERFGIEVTGSQPTDEIDAWQCFTLGAWLTSQEAARGIAAIDGFVCQYFNYLEPRVTETIAFNTLVDSVFAEHGIQTVLQLRIEKDWIAYSQKELAASAHQIEAGEEYLPSFQTILKKLISTHEVPSGTAYVACDEANLPVSKSHISREALSQFGLKLVWKSDILSGFTLSQMNILELSLLDFEMAVRSPYFVGLSRSSFSDLAGFERFCRTRRNVDTHYIYNVSGEGLGRRMDNGSQVLPRRALNPLLRRDQLIAPSEDDYRWQATLVARISNYGDLVTDSCFVIGARTNPLVCGVRGSPSELIEGFTLHLADVAPVGVEYRALLDNETWTPWTQDGQFVGTNGQNRQLCGFSVRLTGQHALSVECICVGSFSGQSDLAIVESGKACRGHGDAKLEAMQIVFRPAYRKRRNMVPA